MKTKRTFALAAVALLAAVVFMSCSGGSSGTSGAASSGAASSNKLTVWTWDPNFNIYAMNKAAEIYAKDHPGFELEITEIADVDIETRITTMASSGDLAMLPDIFLMEDNSFRKYVTYYPEVFTDLTESGIDFSEFAPAKAAYSIVGGRHYGVPFDSGSVISCVRVDYLEQAGFSPDDFDGITWDEFIEKGKAVRAATGQPMLTATAGQCDLVNMMLCSAGRAFFREDGSVYIEDNELLRQCMELYIRMVREGVITEVVAGDQNQAALNNGNVAGALGGGYVISSLTAQPAQSGKWRAVKMPSLPGVEGATHYSSNGGSSWAISSSCKNPDLAVDFLKSTFAGSTELYDDLITKGALATWIPAAASPVYNQPVEFFGGQAVYAFIVETSEHVPTFATSPFYYDAREAVGVALSNILQRGADMDAELKAAQAVVEFNMGE